MPPPFQPYEVPVAQSMLALIRRVSDERARPFQSYMCYWIAFNNVYTTLTAAEEPPEVRHRNGKVQTITVAGHVMPRVKHAPERAQLERVLTYFPDDLKEALIHHESTRFFVERTPIWRGETIGEDSLGQRLNGVVNVGYTVSREHPVWSPIATAAWERYVRHGGTVEDGDELAHQILFLLYTVRNNTFHGGKRADDANDHQVLNHALPLLQMIVERLIQPDRS